MLYKHRKAKIVQAAGSTFNSNSSTKVVTKHMTMVQLSAQMEIKMLINTLIIFVAMALKAGLYFFRLFTLDPIIVEATGIPQLVYTVLVFDTFSLCSPII